MIAELRDTVSSFYSSVDIREKLGASTDGDRTTDSSFVKDEYHLSLMEQEICLRKYDADRRVLCRGALLCRGGEGGGRVRTAHDIVSKGGGSLFNRDHKLESPTLKRRLNVASSQIRFGSVGLFDFLIRLPGSSALIFFSQYNYIRFQ